jgi:hypothetical protein
MKECTLRELTRLLETKRTFHLFLYTPLCGTCKLTERMLEVIEAMEFAPPTELYKSNVNLCAELCRSWHITSVPCMVKMVDGVPADRRYRMQSVDSLYKWLCGDGNDADFGTHNSKEVLEGE